MLQFWKRTGHKDKSVSNSTPPSSPSLPPANSLTNFESSSILAQIDDEGLCDIGDISNQQNSRLSKTLSEVLTDKSALGYFIQYLDAHDGLSFVRCWLDIESFRSVNIQEDRIVSPLPSSRLDHDSLSVSTDCDSYTADSNSLYDFSSVLFDFRSAGEKSLRQDVCDSDKHKLDSEKSSRVSTDDALRIFKKYIAQEAPNPISCPEDLRNNIVEAICTDDGALHSCYDKIQKFVFNILEEKYFNGYLKSHYNCKYQIDVLTSGNIVLQDILYNESILFYFMEFLEQEGNSSLLEFWLAATNFRQQLMSQQSINAEEAQNDAVILYDKYFSLQATCPLGFGDRIRFIIEENICRENGPQPDCFYHPIRIIEHVLDKNYLKPFLSSQLYFKYLSELISTVQTSCANSIRRSRSTYSDCSSEISTNLEEIPRKKPGKTDMNIDTRQLYDPDSLWKRRRTRRLSFGRVTDLGRFETDVEPEPDRKTESRITRAMRRLVHLEESKTKEEMAWQVAEMIVKDITSVTLADVPTSMQS